MSSNVPIGCEYDENAPWNIPEPQEREVDFSLTETIMRYDTIICRQFDIENKELDEAFQSSNSHYSINEMFQMLKEYLEKDIIEKKSKKGNIYLKEMLRQVNLLEVVETEFEY